VDDNAARCHLEDVFLVLAVGALAVEENAEEIHVAVGAAEVGLVSKARALPCSGVPVDHLLDVHLLGVAGPALALTMMTLPPSLAGC